MIARRSPPNLDRAIGTDEEAPVRIEPIQPFSDVLDIGPESGKRIRLEINVAERDLSSLDRLHKTVPLPIDAGVTDRAFCVVPDGQLGKRRSHLALACV